MFVLFCNQLLLTGVIFFRLVGRPQPLGQGGVDLLPSALGLFQEIEPMCRKLMAKIGQLSFRVMPRIRLDRGDRRR